MTSFYYPDFPACYNSCLVRKSLFISNLGHCALNKQYGYIFGDSFLVTFQYQCYKVDLDLFTRENPTTGVTRPRRIADFPLFFIQNN